jgi:hypothetical protein
MGMLLPLGGCGDVLEVEDPDVLKPDQLEGPAALPTRIAGAIVDFQIAYNGDFNNAFVVATGLFSDELVHSETFPDRLQIDRRAVDRTDNQMAEYLYNGLNLARASATDAADAIEEFDPDNENLAYMLTLAGFAEVFTGEAFCSGSPVSTLEGSTIVFGEPRTTAEVFQDAIELFDAALAADPGFNLAKVGRGRALLNLGEFANAQGAVSTVPTSFEAYVTHSSTTPSQENALYNMNRNGRVSVADREGGNGLPFRSAQDPRVPWEDSGGFGFDDETPLFYTLIADAKDTDQLLASGIEARLIEAEALLRDGNRNAFFNIHNNLRASIGLSPLQDTGQTIAQLVDLHFRERGFWLYATGHRMGDLRRLVRQYGRAANTVFPAGEHHKGVPYGTDVNMPLPITENNNPNIADPETGCIDRSA